MKVKVYIVTWGEYSDFAVDKVFSTKRKAENYIKKEKQREGAYEPETLSIVEKELK